VDASGTVDPAESARRDGYPGAGRAGRNAERITYGIPDFNDLAIAARYAGSTWPWQAKAPRLRAS
jgi:hypothetical protein